MALLNGLIDVRTLTPVRGTPGAYLRVDVEASWFALCNEVEATYGWRPTLTGPFDAYRPRSIQESIFRQRYTTSKVTGIDPRGWDSDGNGFVETWWRWPVYAAAAVPGTSNHGLATTVDVANLRYGTERFRQFAAIATKHGWSNVEGRLVNEAWHWTRVSGGAAPAPIPFEEGFMTALTDDEQRRLLGHADTSATRLEQVYNAAVAMQAAIGRHLGPTHATADLTLAATTNITNGIVTLLGRSVGVADVDEKALAEALGPLLSSAAIPDADLDRIAAAVTDEQDRRARARLTTS